MCAYFVPTKFVWRFGGKTVRKHQATPICCSVLAVAHCRQATSRLLSATVEAVVATATAA